MIGDKDMFLTLIKKRMDQSLLEMTTQLESLEKAQSELETRIPRKKMFY